MNAIILVIINGKVMTLIMMKELESENKYRYCLLGF